MPPSYSRIDHRARDKNVIRCLEVTVILLVIGFIIWLLWAVFTGYFDSSSSSPPPSYDVTFVGAFNLSFSPTCWAAVPGMAAMYLCNPINNSVDLWFFNGQTWVTQGYSILNLQQTSHCGPSVAITNGSVLFVGLGCGGTTETTTLMAYTLNPNLTAAATLATNLTASNNFYAGISSAVSLCQESGPCQIATEMTVSTFETLYSTPSATTNAFTSLAMNNQTLYGVFAQQGSPTIVEAVNLSSGATVTLSNVGINFNYVATNPQSWLWYLAGATGFLSFSASNTQVLSTTSVSTQCRFAIDPWGQTLYFVNHSVIISASASTFTPHWNMSIPGAPLVSACELLLLDTQFLVLVSQDRTTLSTWQLSG
jgi:hypothetical protein